MAGFGARNICFAPFSGDEPIDALPKYAEVVNFGRLVKAELAVTMASGKIYGDDVLDESVDEFISASLSVETTDLTLENEAILYGSKIDKESGELVDSTEDAIPYGGLVYIKVLMRKGKKVFRAYYLPKVKAMFSTDTANTKTDSITMASSPISFTVFEPNVGKWRYRQEFNTFAEAKAWCEGKLGTAASASASIDAGEETNGQSDTD